MITIFSALALSVLPAIPATPVLTAIATEEAVVLRVADATRFDCEIAKPKVVTDGSFACAGERRSADDKIPGTTKTEPTVTETFIPDYEPADD
ncbi:MAG: hypothetical protein ACKVPY_01215 [Paracoccaceae bacterium]